jgi:hypothetical protein
MTLPPTDMPPTAAEGFEGLSDKNKDLFGIQYAHKKRSMALMVALSILFPIQLFFLGRIGLAILFLLTGGGFGIWYVIEWFLTPGRVRTYNEKVASEIIESLNKAS